MSTQDISTNLSVVVNDYEISYSTYGDPSNSPLFLIHGLQQTKEGMAEFATLMASEFYVIAHDALGHGCSSKPAHFTLSDQARVLNGLVHELGYQRAFIIGESMGSYIAAQAAILEPQLPICLVLLVTKAHGKTSSVAAFFKRKGIDPASIPSGDMLKAVAEALWCPETSLELREASEMLSAEQVQLSEKQVETINKSLFGFDLRQELPTIPCPTLVVAGKFDGLNPPPMGEEVAKLIPHARLEIFEHSGHMLKVEEPAHLTRLVKSFFKDNAATAFH